MEAEITGGLEHPGIVPVYGLGHFDDGRPFYAMRFIRGQSLKEAIRDFHRRLDGSHAMDADLFHNRAFRNLVQRLIDVCNAIAYAHSRGVLHRDLKPGNIMLGKYGETLVVDWGLAKAKGQSFDPAETAGTPRSQFMQSKLGRKRRLPILSDLLVITSHCSTPANSKVGRHSPVISA